MRSDKPMRGTVEILAADGRVLATATNVTLRSWYGLMALALTTGESKYRLSHIYLEFENMDAPEDESTPPAYDDDPVAAMEYYDGLSASDTRDFLRSPILGATIGAAEGVVDAETYALGDSFELFTVADGATGVNGKAFDEASNSRIVGGMIVAAAAGNDRTGDLPFARFYLVSDQIPVVGGANPVVRWRTARQTS